MGKKAYKLIVLAMGLCAVAYLLVSRYQDASLNVGIIGGSDGPAVIYLANGNGGEEAAEPQSLTAPEGDNLMTRFRTPEGFERVPAETGSYEEWLRALPLKEDGAPVLLFDGREKTAQVHAAVIAMDVGNRDLQQCADAVIRLRGEYLYQSGKRDAIAFDFTNGFRADYSNWRGGKRIKVDGNSVSWTDGGTASDDYSTFRSYLDMVFAYAGTMSLSNELVPVSAENMRAGDVFIQGGSPGHCVVVVDVAENSSGDKRFILAQSYMPAQEIHILKNPGNPGESPWYALDEAEALITPQWTFDWTDLKRFQ